MIGAKLIFLLINLVLASPSPQLNNTAIKTDQKRPWIFFDLGETLIKKQNEGLLGFALGADSYLQNLKESGYRIGLISNIPESFGKDYNEKLKKLKSYVATKWTGKTTLDWSLFDAIILPLNDKERKPAAILFAKAKSLAQGCPVIFIGENAGEIKMANSLGLSTYQVDRPTNKAYFLPVQGIHKSFQKTQSPRQIINCH